MLISKINCRYNHTFIDEDCIGVAKGLARRCHRKLLEVRVLGRFLLRVKTLRHRTNVPVRSARAVIKKMILSTWSWEHLPPKVHIWNFVFYDFLGLYECRLQMPTELSYKPMLFPEPTFVNVDTICIRWILWAWKMCRLRMNYPWKGVMFHGYGMLWLCNKLPDYIYIYVYKYYIIYTCL